jgi:DNA-binding transcriptional LysR family regulator
MTQNEIECFLSICRYKTISRAAKALYITQPSLSARLKTLEKELGGELFHRGKGYRELSLTSAGEQFYRLALEYETLTKQMLNVCRKQSTVLRVSAINSISTYFLPPIYNRFLQKHPEYELEIQDMELEVAKKSILEGTTDIAFTSGRTDDERYVQTPVFVEKMVLVCGKRVLLQEPIEIKDLKQYKEIYIEWNRTYSLWHQHNLKSEHPKITISIMSQLKQFLAEGDCWAILPVSVANSLSNECEVKRVETIFDIPHREISILTSREDKKSVAEFCECIKEIIRDIPDVNPLLI